MTTTLTTTTTPMTHDEFLAELTLRIQLAAGAQVATLALLPGGQLLTTQLGTDQLDAWAPLAAEDLWEAVGGTYDGDLFDALLDYDTARASAVHIADVIGWFDLLAA